MKEIISTCFFFAFAATTFAQKETFDLVSYTPPKAWKKQLAESAIQFSGGRQQQTAGQAPDNGAKMYLSTGKGLFLGSRFSQKLFI